MRKPATSRIGASVILSLLVSTFAQAQGLLVVDGVAAGGRPGGFAFAPLEVSYHHVQVEINDRVATTSVDQEFFNRSSSRLEGTYLLPLPEGATIDKFSMDIDGKQTD